MDSHRQGPLALSEKVTQPDPRETHQRIAPDQPAVLTHRWGEMERVQDTERGRAGFPTPPDRKDPQSNGF